MGIQVIVVDYLSPTIQNAILIHDRIRMESIVMFLIVTVLVLAVLTHILDSVLQSCVKALIGELLTTILVPHNYFVRHSYPNTLCKNIQQDLYNV